mmetsp:Transcript_17071/g.29224  ORF Transcript_17071/g.29224 Transcript_17071/m.29224 type:complete len:236 (+) Transcript_17071:172-879(+)
MQKVVAPCEAVLQVPDSGQLRLGPGLLAQDGHVFATRCGVLKQSKTGQQLWLEGRQKRYIPAELDVVVGTVVDRHGENLTVDIGAPFLALLPQLSFEGATRRNRPAVKAGDLVYARVLAASRDMEPILSCTDTMGRAAGFGHLKEGLLTCVSTSLARHLLQNPPPAVLQALGASVQFEMAVGMNGRVWICGAVDPKDPAASKKAAIIASNAIMNSEFLTEQQVRTLVSRMLQSSS